MTTSSEEIDEVLLQFHEAVDVVTPKVLKEWTNRYPQYANEIRRHAVEIADMELLASIRPPAAVEVVPSPKPSLRIIAQGAGMSLRDLADAMTVPRSIVSDINAGRIEPASIPRRFARIGAEKLGLAALWVLEVARASSEPPAVAAFKAKNGPSEGRKRSWQEAIEASEMTDEARAFWLNEDEE
jgi:hypothetical protein